MRTMDDDAARRVVADHADEVLALTGWAGFASGASESVPGPAGATTTPSATSAYVCGSYQLLVPLAQQRAVVERLAQGWAQRGYTVGPVTVYPDGGAKVRGRSDFVDMTLASGEPPAMVLVIVTDWYRRP